MKQNFMFTSQSVTEGHPDKLCDQISDAIVDHALRQDPQSRIVTESAISSDILFISSMYESSVTMDVAGIARGVLQRIGYDDPEFNDQTCSVVTSLRELNDGNWHRFDEKTLNDTEIDAIPVSNQVTQFGYACDHSETLMPLPIVYAHELAKQLSEVRKNGLLPELLPDGKTQVGIEFVERRPKRIHSITIMTGYKKEVLTSSWLSEEIVQKVIHPVFDGEVLQPDANTIINVNPFLPVKVGWGPLEHAGLTGRKTDVDAYGEFGRHSSSALSGKGPLRIDRISAYAARYAAKNIVAAGLADECEVQLSYTIGYAEPVSVVIDTFGTGKIDEAVLTKAVKELFDFRLAGILKHFDLRNMSLRYKEGFFEKLAAYGQMGRNDLDCPWERIDKVAELSTLLQ